MNRVDILNQIRYAERLCQRTARLYRRLQTVSTWLTVIGGSTVLTAFGSTLPHAVSFAGAAVFAVFGAVIVAVRPTEKAAANEADARKYAELRTRGVDMPDEDLERALLKARESDAPGIEPLRDVAWNDVAARSAARTLGCGWD